MILDVRERILQRLQACIGSLAPGVVYDFPRGRTHRPITTDLGGRVFARALTQERYDATELPCVELLTHAGTPDTIREVSDDDLYLADMKVQVFGFVKATDAGDGKDAPVRAKLNAFRADLIVALEAFPYWTSADYPEAITRSVGPVVMVLEAVYTEPAISAPDSYVVIDYAIRYVFNRLDP
jgi:hypothetical protein